jgi:hypothetical protein
VNGDCGERNVKPLPTQGFTKNEENLKIVLHTKGIKEIQEEGTYEKNNRSIYCDRLYSTYSGNSRSMVFHVFRTDKATAGTA